jgi:large subunit ribosomal protein L13e
MPYRVNAVVEGGTKRARKGKGFSLGELKEAKISPGKAKMLGVPIDTRRKTSYDDNIEILKEYIESAIEAGIRTPRPKQTSKPHKGRAYRGLTSSGKKMRNLTHKK